MNKDNIDAFFDSLTPEELKEKWETYLEVGRGEVKEWVKDCVLEDIKSRWKISGDMEEEVIEYLEETYYNLIKVY